VVGAAWPDSTTGLAPTGATDTTGEGTSPGAPDKLPAPVDTRREGAPLGLDTAGTGGPLGPTACTEVAALAAAAGVNTAGA
jgi:hypothetical protein